MNGDRGSGMTRNKRGIGAGLLAVYIGSVVAANWLTTRYGLVHVGLGLLAPAGTVVIGGVIPAQDYEYLYANGAAAIFGPGTVLPVAAQKILTELNKRIA